MERAHVLGSLHAPRLLAPGVRSVRRMLDAGTARAG
jgi:hypothetical protein